MAAIADIAVQDGQATPTTHTFKPLKSGPDSQWRTALSSLPVVGQEVLSLSSVLSPQTGLTRVKLMLDVPALETATGNNSSGYTAAPRQAYTHRVRVEFMLPARGTQTQRTDLRTLLKNLLSNAQVVDAIDGLAPPF